MSKHYVLSFTGEKWTDNTDIKRISRCFRNTHETLGTNYSTPAWLDNINVVTQETKNTFLKWKEFVKLQKFGRTTRPKKETCFKKNSLRSRYIGTHFNSRNEKNEAIAKFDYSECKRTYNILLGAVQWFSSFSKKLFETNRLFTKLIEKKYWVEFTRRKTRRNIKHRQKNYGVTVSDTLLSRKRNYKKGCLPNVIGSNIGW